LKLLLDELYAPIIAVQLRERGHDVEAAKERPKLWGLNDGELLAVAVDEHRALLTENVGHFMRLFHEYGASATDHYGMIFTSPRRFPRGSRTVGLFVEAIAALLVTHPEEDAFVNHVWWLSPPDGTDAVVRAR